MVKTALPNADKAAILLYSLPPEDAETVLELLGPDHGPRLRELMGYSLGGPVLGFYSTPGAPGEGVELAPPQTLFGGDDVMPEVETAGGRR